MTTCCYNVKEFSFPKKGIDVKKKRKTEEQKGLRKLKYVMYTNINGIIPRKFKPTDYLKKN